MANENDAAVRCTYAHCEYELADSKWRLRENAYGDVVPAHTHSTEPFQYTTYDGVLIAADLRVYTTECKWGRIGREQYEHGGITAPGGQYFNGWFTVWYDNGGGALLDGLRMTTSPGPDAS